MGCKEAPNLNVSPRSIAQLKLSFRHGNRKIKRNLICQTFGSMREEWGTWDSKPCSWCSSTVISGLPPSCYLNEFCMPKKQSLGRAIVEEGLYGFLRPSGRLLYKTRWWTSWTFHLALQGSISNSLLSIYINPTLPMSCQICFKHFFFLFCVAQRKVHPFKFTCPFPYSWPFPYFWKLGTQIEHYF